MQSPTKVLARSIHQPLVAALITSRGLMLPLGLIVGVPASLGASPTVWLLKALRKHGIFLQNANT